MKTNNTLLNIEYIKVQSEADKDFEVLSEAQFDQICRTCLSHSQLNPIFKLNYNEQSFSTILQSCAAVVIKEDDNLPQNICKNCIEKTIDLYNYILQCQQSEVTLKNVLQNGDQKHTMPVNNVFEVHVEVTEMKHENDIESDTSQSENNVQSENLPISEDEDACAENDDSEDTKEVQTKKRRRWRILKPQGPPYSCSKCDVSYETLEEFREHRKQVKHPRARNYICTVCKKSFTYHSLKLHMRTHTKEKPYSCKNCEMKFSLKCNLQRHMMKHTGERPHRCEQCGKGFIQGGSLRDHLKTHIGDPFTCSYCEKTFSRSASYKAHLLTHKVDQTSQDNTTKNQNALQKVQCNICNKLLSSKGVLKTHLLIHGERKKYLCSVCGRGFCNNSLLQSHLKVHTDTKSYSCPVCNKTFASQPVLKAHLVIHGEKKCLCSVCGKGFCSKAGLESHFKVHTGSRPYPCTICSKSFSQLGSLKSHIHIHTGQKPHLCKVCGKAFTQSSHLKYHTRAHAGERPYSCSFCGKSFTSKGTLTVHVRTHTGETPYVCNVCNKGFYDSSSMKKHRRGHGEIVQKCTEKVDVNLMQTLEH